MLSRLFTYRFEIFLTSLMTILFGSLLVPSSVFEDVLFPLLLLSNILSGIVLMSKKEKIMYFFLLLFAIRFLFYLFEFSNALEEKNFYVVKTGIFFIFYLVVTYEIIQQVWKAKNVNKNVIIGLVSGFVSLGLIGFFICLSIEMFYPNSFHISQVGDNSFSYSILDNMMYFSYVTLLTIGYGDIYPISRIAHKASLLIGLSGQLYLVIITSIVVGKYINQSIQK
jgi:voltage-gated potassium channel